MQSLPPRLKRINRNPPHRSDDKAIDRVPVPVAFAFATIATKELLLPRD
jgi:hypothetical protein